MKIFNVSKKINLKISINEVFGVSVNFWFIKKLNKNEIL